jgi:CO dehydrogenase maturation factor
VNNLLRKSLDDLAKNYAAVVMDNEAGMEHLSRRTTNDVDFLLVVADPTLPALRAAARILTLSQELPVKIGRRAMLVNRVGREGIPQRVGQALEELDAWRLPDVPQDDDLQQAGALARGIFGLSQSSPALAAIGEVLKALRASLSAQSRDRRSRSEDQHLS